jgi:hypothetical protein
VMLDGVVLATVAAVTGCCLRVRRLLLERLLVPREQFVRRRQIVVASLGHVVVLFGIRLGQT